MIRNHLTRLLLTCLALLACLARGANPTAGSTGRRRDERGDGAVPWLIVLGAGIAIAYFAGDSVMTFAKGLVADLGGGN